ncbi:MAG: hypothetical protein JEZ07_14415 [Phycisphaerae bacterium]|nr:hypothetical protein [Phycisphaerae bacterium]
MKLNLRTTSGLALSLVWLLSLCGCSVVPESKLVFDHVILSGQVSILDANDKAIIYSKNHFTELWHFDLTTKKETYIAKGNGVTSRTVLHPNGRWIAYTIKDFETSLYTFFVYDTQIKTNIFTGVEIPLIAFINWINPYTLMIGIDDSSPRRLLSYYIQDHDDVHVENSKVLYHSPEFGNYIFNPATDQHHKIEITKEIYSVKGPAGNNFTGAFSYGGIFCYNEKNKKISETDEGYRPDINPMGNLVVYQTPSEDMYIWNHEKNSFKQVAKGENPFFIDNDTIIFSDSQGIKMLTIQNN